MNLYVEAVLYSVDLMAYIIPYLGFQDLFEVFALVNKRWNYILHHFLHTRPHRTIFRLHFGVVDFHGSWDTSFKDYMSLSEAFRHCPIRCNVCVLYDESCQHNDTALDAISTIKRYSSLNFGIRRDIWDEFTYTNKHTSINYLYYGLKPRKTTLKHGIRRWRSRTRTCLVHCYTEHIEYLNYSTFGRKPEDIYISIRKRYDDVLPPLIKNCI